MNHYLYRHIRLDKNEPFYIGIGTKEERYSSHEEEYKRAYSKNSRSNFWKRVVKKTEYLVEILIESDDYNFIKSKEIEFIALYGRSNLNKGPLCNLTDGGDGTLGYKPTEETIRNLIEAKKRSLHEHKGKSIFQYSLSGEFIKEWATITKAARFFKIDKSLLHRVVTKKDNNSFAGGFYWSIVKMDRIKTLPYTTSFHGKILMLNKDTEQTVSVFDSKTDALLYLNKNPNSASSIKRAIRKNGVAYGFKWKEVIREN